MSRKTTVSTPAITRRDFINGVLVSGATGIMEGQARAAGTAGIAPPARTGMRGSHPGAFEAAHALRDGTVPAHRIRKTGEVYDLVIVGGGLSGLSAAHFFRKYAGADKKILIIDNHDDFGGHAKRNEFSVDGARMVLNGGTLEVESPERYNQWARMILDDIGVDLDRYLKENAPNESLYSSHGMGPGLFFDQETWHADTLVRSAVGTENCLNAHALQHAPLSRHARADLMRLLSARQPDYLHGRSVAEKKKFLASISYPDYLSNWAKVDPSILWFFRKAGSGVFCVGSDTLPALFAWTLGLPGFSGLGLGDVPEGLLADLPGGQHGRQKESGHSVHFPDGNATLARLLVASLIPAATKAHTQEDMATATFDYAALDRARSNVRLRLGSMVMNVAHDGAPDQARQVSVLYTAAGDGSPTQYHQVQARQVVMACWNMFIPYLVPTLPETQKKALAYGVKGPIVYVNVALRNWRAFEKLGVSEIRCPGMYFDEISLAEPAALGGLSLPSDPDRPIVIRMIKTFSVPGLSKREQYRAARGMLLGISFETFEHEIRNQLQRVLGAGGFDATRDIAAITVNRWPHGYAYTYNSLYDPAEWVFTETQTRPCVVGRQLFGRIAIANSDAAASPHTDAAFLEAHRAVTELLDAGQYPFVPTVPGNAADTHTNEGKM
ncbi:hypothetical protein KOEU_20830 [Komagataeibacter europaeus]|uniref:Protoporphyrinogen oxidase n=1 Tax=Komagataeibacter europaeus TaxID=33995 RepID=A0A0M0EGF6_KOMEU|nr:FAD/NAD(P)-binding protein [Komagataeibacter europaeus]KON64340.1 hypothetical protein KOEU_20830 [Komagataeibacter europaeus]